MPIKANNTATLVRYKTERVTAVKKVVPADEENQRQTISSFIKKPIVETEKPKVSAYRNDMMTNQKL